MRNIAFIAAHLAKLYQVVVGVWFLKKWDTVYNKIIKKERISRKFLLFGQSNNIVIVFKRRILSTFYVHSLKLWQQQQQKLRNDLNMYNNIGEIQRIWIIQWTQLKSWVLPTSRDRSAGNLHERCRFVTNQSISSAHNWLWITKCTWRLVYYLFL